MASRIRTVLIDDSAFMRRLISDIISNDHSLELVGVASNGRDGEKMALELMPDVVITDMVMSDFDGVQVVNSLMSKRPVPIILLSSLEKTDTRIFDALQSGAFEFIDKPTDYRNERMQEYGLVQLIREAARADVRQLKGRQSRRNNSHHSFGASKYEIIVIGASTGGPGAIELIVSNLPENLYVPVVAVQHMPSRFLESFATRLNDTNTAPVRLASKGETLKNGIVYIAPGDGNLRVDRNLATGEAMFTISQKKYREFNNPSIDCLFESVAETFGERAIAVILTGMGRDGAQGMKRIKEAGGFTIAQDEHSCVVYGMPKVAKETGAVRQVVDLKEIPGFIVSCF